MVKLRLISRNLIVLTVFAIAACADPQEATDEVATDTPVEPVAFVLPDDPNDEDGYSPIKAYEPMDVPDDNPITLEGARLGRLLYYDNRLSGDGSRSCYSCHVVEHGLTDGLPTAIGAHNKQLTRSSPTMWNVGYLAELYWDGRANSLEKQAKAAWTGGNMGAKNADSVIDVINAIAGYRARFQDVFGEDANVTNIPKALATYMRTLISDDTPWDRWQDGDESAVSDAAKRGYEVFIDANCASCHSGVLLTDQQFHNVGVGMDTDSYDVGRFKVTNLRQNRGAFKTPTLRDIARSAPYFHNGSVPTLIEAVKIVLAGGIDNEFIDQELEPQDISEEELADLLEFLGTLSQESNLGQVPALP